MSAVRRVRLSAGFALAVVALLYACSSHRIAWPNRTVSFSPRWLPSMLERAALLDGVPHAPPR